MRKKGTSMDDHVDGVRELWRREWPSLDTSPVDIAARVGRTATFFDVHVEALLSSFGLNRESWDILASLRRSGPPYTLSPTELYRGLMRTSGAITNRLSRLENEGLISRVKHSGDRRAMLVQLTPKGLSLTNDVAPAHLNNERKLVSALTLEEQKQLANLLRKLLLSFESSKSGPPMQKEWWVPPSPP
jgi:DNA-binding MarR family transcriptional regulator